MSSLTDAIYDLTASVATIYLPANIFLAYGNNYSLPADNNYIIITEQPTKTLSTPYHKYDDIAEITTIDALCETLFQVDFYGDNANATSKKFKLVIEDRLGTEFLTPLGFSIAVVEDAQNLSLVMDRDVYVQRWAVRFTVFNNNMITPITPSFDVLDVNVDTVLVETLNDNN